MYENEGDHYYLSGPRSEGLIAGYYLAHYLKDDELADFLLKACIKSAFCQFQLSINEVNNFAHLNPKKSVGGIKFKATRQWLRIDAVQHSACFFMRLYNALKKD